MTMTIEQERAHFALENVREHEHEDSAFRSRFRSYAKSLPAMIRMNGLGQALAFCRSKGSGTSTEARAYTALYAVVSEWMVKDRQPLHPYGDLLDGITQVDMGLYRMAQVEAMALMEWVRKFAMAFLGDDDTTSASTGGGHV